MKTPKAFAFASLIFLARTAIAPCSAQITVEIVNKSGVASDKVYLLFTGDSPVVDGIMPGVPIQLSALTNHRFTLDAVSAGRITFSYNGSVPANQNPTQPSNRFDKVELTYPGAANLTAVDFFGIPFTLETLDNTGKVVQELAYYTSTNSLVRALEVLAPDAKITTDGLPGGPFARLLSPSLAPSAYPDLRPYANSVVGKPLTISGTYVGPVAPSDNAYDYSGTFRSDSTITLTGTMTKPANPPAAPLRIEGSTLASAIYTNNGPYSVDNRPRQVSDNDVYAAIYRDLIAGFGFGYVGGIYGNDSGEWYGTTPYHPPYACARNTDDGYFNQYASLIAANSDAYGFPFSDLLQLVQVALNPGGTKDVATLRITVLPDDTLDAPMIHSTSATDNSLTVAWTAIAGTTDYKVRVSPPLAGQTFDAGASTSYTVSDLNPGTPYTVSVTAANATSTSEAIPIVVSTRGSAREVPGSTNSVTWNFIPNFTGTFPTDKITFNGVTQILGGTKNPALQFNDVPGLPGQNNTYVFDWRDADDKPIYRSVLYVDLESSPSTGMGTINRAPAATFMAANQNLPTYADDPFNLFLSIAPTAQRTPCSASGAKLRRG
jgi:hypothetical protein